MYRTARGAFEAFGEGLAYSAQTLGLGNTYIFWRIRMPNCRQGILAGTVLSFARALGEYGATSMLCGYTPGRTAAISTTVYQLWRTNDDGAAFRWVMVNLSISFVVLLVSHDRDEVFRFADGIAVLNAGRMDAFGTKAEVFHNPQTRMGAMLTGCKNISAIEVLDDTHIRAADWDMILEVPALAPDVKAVGIRMHDIRHGPGKNGFRCRVAEEIENPFSYTVMLRASPAAAPVGWEMNKEIWQKLRAGEVDICLPPEALLLLKDETKEVTK